MQLVVLSDEIIVHMCLECLFFSLYIQSTPCIGLSCRVYWQLLCHAEYTAYSFVMQSKLAIAMSCIIYWQLLCSCRVFCVC